ncbi:hypothetical protein HanPSC8_Chr10g0422551 [Helianthus annuus]|nr:hypothetical protein HanPSC8_Chr10g0422551 [Helianthus annuus]
MTLVVVVPKFSVHLFGGQRPGPAVGIKDRRSKSLTGKFQRFQLRVFGSSYVSVLVRRSASRSSGPGHCPTGLPVSLAD